MVQHLNFGLCYTLFFIVCFCFHWHFFSVSVGTKGPRNIKLIWLNLLKSPSFHFFYVKFFYICFVYVFDSVCAYSQWPLCLLFGGFPSLMYSIRGLICVGGGGGGGRGMGVMGVTYCMSLWAFLPSLCASVCFAWLNYMEVHLQILNVTFVGHLCVIIRTARLKKNKALLLIWHAVYDISSPNCCYSILHTKCDLFPVALWIVASIDPNANTAL